ncbi:helix-turn-helix domain-containing protein [Streptomyces sp. NPDC092952]|uniref:helix-turn-helix domain-containing protein n=1 Tax=Streptomyces sp. NPDC092952 TaxID=3366018 RepID=UPI00381CCB21
MHRLARSGGSRELLHWVSGRAAGWAGLLDGDGTVLHAVDRGTDGTGTAAAALAGAYAKDIAGLDARAFSFDHEQHTALLLPLDGPDGSAGPILAVVASSPPPNGLARLLSDVATPLALCWTAEEVESKRRRVELAESRSREAVLHLLMTGQLSIAHQVAGALRPPLPDPVRVYVVECANGRRDEVARICTELSGGRSWIVRCPVYARHLILIVPTDTGVGADSGPGTDADAAELRLGLRVAEAVPECVVGISADLPLPDTATGYRQAFHALAVARTLPDRHSRFGSTPDPAVATGAAGAQWADQLLHPLLAHLPRRAQDPGSQELSATLASWLAFSSHATHHLKIHRNTLAARLRLIGELLGLDLNRVGDQATLDLALRIRATPTEPRAPHRPGERTPGGTPPDLDELLHAPAVREWAAQQLRPLTGGPGTPRNTADPLDTLRVWLRHEAQLAPAAEALGISVPGMRKRLTRLESVLGRSLLQAPSARYDLWLALRSLDTPDG